MCEQAQHLRLPGLTFFSLPGCELNLLPDTLPSTPNMVTWKADSAQCIWDLYPLSLAHSLTHLLSSLTHTHCIFVTVAVNAERTPVLGQIPSLQLENGTNCLSLAEFFLRMIGMKCFYKSMFKGRRRAGGFCRNWQIQMLLMVEKEDLLE